MNSARRLPVLAAVALALAVSMSPAAADPSAGEPAAKLDNPFLRAYQNGFAQSVAFAGDVDGDGYDELMVAALWWSGDDTFGRVALYPGSSTGPDQEPVTVRAPRGSYGFGRTMGSAGDIDADGYDDVVIADFSSAWVYYGSAAGLQPPVEIPLPDQKLYYVSVSGAGDVNGDGYDDVIAGAGDWDGAFRNQGRVDVHLGSPSGLQPRTVRLYGAQQDGARFGSDVSPAGDVDGDGYDDIMVGAPYWRDGDGPHEGRVFVYRGAPDGIARPAWHADPTDRGRARFGSVLSPAGDVNDDGYDDVVLGVFGGSERFYVYLGSAGGSTRPALTPTLTGGTDDGFGTAVAGAGDVDGDGFDDIVVGAPYANDGKGRSFVFLGGEGGPADQVITRDPPPTHRQDVEYGATVAGGGDLNGDGSPEVAVGAPSFPVEHFRGSVFVYN